MCASAWTRRGPRGLPSPRIFMVLGDMKAAFVRPPPRDLGVRGVSIVQCGLSCLVDLNSDLYRLCGSLHGLNTFWARGLSWINKGTTTTTTAENVGDSPIKSEWLCFQNLNVIQLQPHSSKNPIVLYKEMWLHRWLHVSKLLSAGTSQRFNWSGPRPGTWNFL